MAQEQRTLYQVRKDHCWLCRASGNMNLKVVLDGDPLDGILMSVPATLSPGQDMVGKVERQIQVRFPKGQRYADEATAMMTTACLEPYTGRSCPACGNFSSHPQIVDSANGIQWNGRDVCEGCGFEAEREDEAWYRHSGIMLAPSSRP